jgi:hypothetical protein
MSILASPAPKKAYRFDCTDLDRKGDIVNGVCGCG